MGEAVVFFPYSGELDLEAKATYRIFDGRFTVVLLNLAERGERRVSVADWQRGLVYENQDLSNSKIVSHLEMLGFDFGMAVKWHKPEDFLYIDEREPARTPSLRRQRQSYVYFIHDTSNDHVKIGRSIYPGSRLQELQRMTKSKLVLLKLIKGDRYNERALHERWDDFHVHREWFRYEGALKEYIDGLPEDPDEDE